MGLILPGKAAAVGFATLSGPELVSLIVYNVPALLCENGQIQDTGDADAPCKILPAVQPVPEKLPVLVLPGQHQVEGQLAVTGPRPGQAAEGGMFVEPEGNCLFQLPKPQLFRGLSVEIVLQLAVGLPEERPDL